MEITPDSISSITDSEDCIDISKVEWENPSSFSNSNLKEGIHFVKMGKLGVAVDIWTGGPDYGSRIIVFGNKDDVDKLAKEIDSKLDSATHYLTENEQELRSTLFALGSRKTDNFEFVMDSRSKMVKFRHCLIVAKNDTANITLHMAIPVLIREGVLPEGIDNLIPKN